MEATLQQFDALRSPGRTIRGHVDVLAGRDCRQRLELAVIGDAQFARTVVAALEDSAAVMRAVVSSATTAVPCQH
jgi:hypothetical protein